MVSNVILTIEKVTGIYSILLIIAGTIGNLCAAVVCFRKSFRKTPTFIFVGFALIGDVISLYFWNVDHYLSSFESFQMEGVNIFMCKIATFFQTTSLEWSAWLLVIKFIQMFLIYCC